MKKAELIHWRLQAIIRENNMPDLKYLGIRSDSIGVPQHWYQIGKAEVPCDAITELDTEITDDDQEESDTL